MAVLSPERTHRAPMPATAEVVAGMGTVGLVAAALLPVAGIEDGPVLCPFRALTGLPCPGCGLTRSWVYLTHGDLGNSVVSNPFGIPLALGVAVLLGYAVRNRVSGRPALDFERLVRSPWGIATVIAWLAFAVVRLVLTAL